MRFPVADHPPTAALPLRRSFPYLSVGMLLPCAVLAALGIKVLFCAWFMVAWEVFDSLNLVWTQASGVFLSPFLVTRRIRNRLL